jgi:hypothetical protein
MTVKKSEEEDLERDAPVDDDNPTVSLADDEEPKELDLDDDEPAPEAKPSRAAKKRERGQNMVKQAQEEAATARREAAELKGRLDAYEAQQRQTQQANQKDPLEEETAAARREYASYVTRFQAAQQRANAEKRGLTQQEQEAFDNEGWALKDRMDEINVRRHMKKHAPAPQATQAEAARQAQIARVRASHGDLLADQRSSQLFQAQWALALAEGKPDTEATMDEAADAVRRRVGLAPKSGRPAPTEATRRRLSAQPQSSGAREEEEGRPLTLTREIRKMADAALPHIKDKKKRYEHYARTVGRELRKDGLA